MHSPATLGYLCASPEHYWRWECDFGGPGHESAIWHDEPSTIILRQELTVLLKDLALDGLPPLGSILLVVAAACENWDAGKVRRRIWDAAQRATGNEDVPAGVVNMWRHVGHGLDQIHALPADLRAGGPARQTLLRAVFEGAFNRLPVSISTVVLAQFLETPDLSVFQQPTPELNGLARLLRDLAILDKAFSRWPVSGLEQRLRTGIDGSVSDQLDLPLDVPDDTPVPEVPVDLLEALEQAGGEPGQVAGVVRRLAAILHVPKPMASQEELPVGGVSDITNRGDPSRLLMTELAWDDMTFAVRLAQGEALYMRRESPPREPPPQRLVLLDTGIFMWGRPRLFGLGAALALQRQKGSEAAGGQVVTLAAGRFMAVSLETVEQVRDQLARLEPQPHPGNALTLLLENEAALFTPTTEVFLITTPDALEPVTRVPAWQDLASRVPLHSLVVGRDGALVLSRHSLAGSRVLAQARVDLDELLQGGERAKAASSPARELTHEPGQVPQFYQRQPWPLYIPSPPMPGKTFILPGVGLVGLAECNTLGWWKECFDSGRVLCPVAPTRDLFAVALDPEDENRVFFVFRNEARQEVVIVTAPLSGAEEAAQFTLNASVSRIRGIRMQSGALVIHQSGIVQALSPQDGRVIASTRPTTQATPWFDGEKFSPQGRSESPKLMTAPMKVPRRHSKRPRITHIEHVGFDSAGGLLVQKEQGRVYHFEIKDNGGLAWIVKTPTRPTLRPLTPMTLPDWPDHGLRQAEFPDGRRIIHDPRGFLHVIDRGEHAQEFSMVLVKGSTAAWQRKGFYYGEPSLLWEEALGANNTLKGIFKTLFRAVPPMKATLKTLSETR